MSGGVELFGIGFHAQALWSLWPAKASDIPTLIPEVYELGAGAGLTLRVDNFLSQQVLCYRGNWATRRQIIKHIANFGGGVHHKAPTEEEGYLLERMRASCIYGVREGVVFAHLMPELGRYGMLLRLEGEPPRDFVVSDLDALLVEVLAAAKLLANSPDVKALEEIVRREIGGL